MRLINKEKMVKTPIGEKLFQKLSAISEIDPDYQQHFVRGVFEMLKTDEQKSKLLKALENNFFDNYECEIICEDDEDENSDTEEVTNDNVYIQSEEEKAARLLMSKIIVYSWIEIENKENNFDV